MVEGAQCAFWQVTTCQKPWCTPYLVLVLFSNTQQTQRSCLDFLTELVQRQNQVGPKGALAANIQKTNAEGPHPDRKCPRRLEVLCRPSQKSIPHLTMQRQAFCSVPATNRIRRQRWCSNHGQRFDSLSHGSRVILSSLPSIVHAEHQSVARSNFRIAKWRYGLVARSIR